MKSIYIIFMLLFFIKNVTASSKAIYGKDDRNDLYLVSTQLILELQRSVGAMIHKDKIKNNGEVTGQKLGKRYCSEIRFSDQIMAAKCTGFLVAPNVIATAGHCFKKKTDCSEYRWVFGFENKDKVLARHLIPSYNIYTCKKILEKKFSDFGAIDHALIELDRNVAGRAPLEYRRTGKLEIDDQLVLVGHPSGLPAKIVEGGVNLGNDHNNFFVTDLDSFGGNSGGPVFNARTGIVEGIQNKGHASYIKKEGKNCKIPKVCQIGECHLARATRITNISLLLKGIQSH